MVTWRIQVTKLRVTQLHNSCAARPRLGPSGCRVVKPRRLLFIAHLDRRAPGRRRQGIASEGHFARAGFSGATIWRRSGMARRSRDWNVGLAEDLRDRQFAREFLLASIDEGVPLQVALGKVVRAMGVKEFAAKVRMASPNLLRTLNQRHNPTQETLNRLLRPFRLKLSLAPMSSRPRGRHAA